MTDPIKLAAHDTAIRTAEVSIRCLVIGRKQVNLSVFRQFPSENVLDRNGTLRGTLWGTVHYCWKGCDSAKHGRSPDDHSHVIWQLEDSLFRDCLRDRDFTHTRFRGGDGSLESNAMRYLAAQRLAGKPYPGHPEWHNGVLLNFQGHKIGFAQADFIWMDVFKEIKFHDWRDGIPVRKLDADSLQRRADDSPLIQNRILAALRPVVRQKQDQDNYNCNAARGRMEIDALEQLYIAV